MLEAFYLLACSFIMCRECAPAFQLPQEISGEFGGDVVLQVA